MSRKVFVQGPGLAKVAMVEIDGTATLADLVERARGVGITAGETPVVLLEDADEPLDVSASLDSVGIRDRSGVHVGHCHRVAVSVRYAGGSRSRDFSPAQRLRHVFDWAIGKHGFDVPPGDAQDLVLLVTGTTDPLDLDDHVGLLVQGSACDVSLDLVPRDRIQGRWA